MWDVQISRGCVTNLCCGYINVNFVVFWGTYHVCIFSSSSSHSYLCNVRVALHKWDFNLVREDILPQLLIAPYPYLMRRLRLAGRHYRFVSADITDPCRAVCIISRIALQAYRHNYILCLSFKTLFVCNFSKLCLLYFLLLVFLDAEIIFHFCERLCYSIRHCCLNLSGAHEACWFHLLGFYWRVLGFRQWRLRQGVVGWFWKWRRLCVRVEFKWQQVPLMCFPSELSIFACYWRLPGKFLAFTFAPTSHSVSWLIINRVPMCQYCLIIFD